MLCIAINKAHIAQHVDNTAQGGYGAMTEPSVLPSMAFLVKLSAMCACVCNRARGSTPKARASGPRPQPCSNAGRAIWSAVRPSHAAGCTSCPGVQLTSLVPDLAESSGYVYTGPVCNQTLPLPACIYLSPVAVYRGSHVASSINRCNTMLLCSDLSVNCQVDFSQNQKLS